MCSNAKAININHREPTLDILQNEWSETAKNSRRYDYLVSSPAREGAKFTGAVGAGGRKRDGQEKDKG